jgi:hypothetical protein
MSIPQGWVDCIETHGGAIEIGRVGDIYDPEATGAGWIMWLAGMEIILNAKFTAQIFYIMCQWTWSVPDGFFIDDSGNYTLNLNCTDAQGGPFTTLAAMAAALPDTLYGTYSGATSVYPGHNPQMWDLVVGNGGEY